MCWKLFSLKMTTSFITGDGSSYTSYFKWYIVHRQESLFAGLGKTAIRLRVKVSSGIFIIVIATTTVADAIIIPVIIIVKTT